MERSLKYNWTEFFKICDDSRTRLGGQDSGLKIIFKTTSDNISDGLSFGSDIMRWWKESSSKIIPHSFPPSNRW